VSGDDFSHVPVPDDPNSDPVGMTDAPGRSEACSEGPRDDTYGGLMEGFLIIRRPDAEIHKILAMELHYRRGSRPPAA
jgi:hypothetical protein